MLRVLNHGDRQVVVRQKTGAFTEIYVTKAARQSKAAAKDASALGTGSYSKAQWKTI